MNEKTKSKLQKIKEEQERLGREVREKTIGYIVAALGLVTGLAWNDAIKTAIEYIFPLSSNSIFAKFFYAFLITIIIVLLSTYLVRLAGKKELST
jgi:hypothetical protein